MALQVDRFVGQFPLVLPVERQVFLFRPHKYVPVGRQQALPAGHTPVSQLIQQQGNRGPLPIDGHTVCPQVAQPAAQNPAQRPKGQHHPAGGGKRGGPAGDLHPQVGGRVPVIQKVHADAPVQGIQQGFPCHHRQPDQAAGQRKAEKKDFPAPGNIFFHKLQPFPPFGADLSIDFILQQVQKNSNQQKSLRRHPGF